jgi:xylan 1,4-beta-xylosidase
MRTSLLLPLAAGLLLPLSALAQTAPAPPTPTETPPAAFPVSIQIDASRTIGPWKPIWRFFGADEPNYATMKDGKKLLGELGAMDPGNVYFRTHNLLTSGDGTPAFKWGSTNAYTEDANGTPIYNWTILDGIFDTYRDKHVRPYAQIGFMPEALSTNPEPYQHNWRPGRGNNGNLFTGWAYPPKDYDKWEELVYQWVKHCVERYGKSEVEKWYWEIWNEANIGYWKGTPEEYRKLYDFAVAGVQRALPTARIGGADSAGNGGQFTKDFIEHCLRGTNLATGKVGSPLDFVSFHAKGSPEYVDANGRRVQTGGHVRMGILNQLRDINSGFAIMASYPETKDKPIVIGESDPDTAAANFGPPQLGYRTVPLYASYTAAAIARELELADRHGVNLEGAVTWAFEFEDQPYFQGQRVLATNGIDLPILDLFRMYRLMDGQRATVTSDGAIGLDDIMRAGVRGTPDVAAIATVGRNKLCAMVWHYHDDDVPAPAAAVTLAFAGLPAGVTEAKLTHWRIDATHSNAIATWQRLGSPAAPTADQYRQLVAAGQLEQLSDAPDSVPVAAGAATLAFNLPREAVSLLVLEWK